MNDYRNAAGHDAAAVLRGAAFVQGRAAFVPRRAAFAVAAFSALALGCARPPPPAGAAGPVEAVQAFAAALAARDVAAAWSMLSTRTQQAADALAARARETGAGPGSGRQMLFASAVPGGAITARELSQDGGAAQVEVIDASKQPHAFRAVKEGALWKVELDLAVR
jgi:hypothetical protein